MAEPQAPQGQKQGGARPGAMTMAMQAVQIDTGGPKVLRVALVRNGKILEERTMSERSTVSVGTSEQNQFIVHAEGFPSRFELFQIVGSDYILNFTDEMKGRVGLAGGVQELGQLRASGGARNAGTHWQVKLSDNARGRVEISGTTLLFQFVEPPPVQPRPQLPAAVRAGFAKNMDWNFAAYVILFFMLFMGGAVAGDYYDPEIESGINAIPDHLARLIYEEPPEPEEDVEEETTEEETDEAAEEEAPEPEPTRQRPQQREQTAESSSSSSSSSADDAAAAAAAAERNARIAASAAAAAESMLLGALGGSGGALADTLAHGAPTGNAADVLAQAAGATNATGSQAGMLRRSGGGGGSGESASLGGLTMAARAGMAAMEGMAVAERQVRGRVGAGRGRMSGSGDFDQALVVRMIRRRIRSIRSCYERALRQNPNLSGKVKVRFTIQPSGSTSGASAIENTTGNAGLGSCVVSTVNRFRFNPGPTGGSVTFTYPFVFQPQN